MRLYTRILGSSMRESHSPRGIQGGPRCAAGAPQIRICEFLGGPAAGSVVQYASVQTHTGLQYACVRAHTGLQYASVHTQYCARTCACWSPVCAPTHAYWRPVCARTATDRNAPSKTRLRRPRALSRARSRGSALVLHLITSRRLGRGLGGTAIPLVLHRAGPWRPPWGQPLREDYAAGPPTW